MKKQSVFSLKVHSAADVFPMMADEALLNQWLINRTAVILPAQ